MKKANNKPTPLERIKIVMDYYLQNGGNSIPIFNNALKVKTLILFDFTPTN